MDQVKFVEDRFKKFERPSPFNDTLFRVAALKFSKFQGLKNTWLHLKKTSSGNFKIQLLRFFQNPRKSTDQFQYNRNVGCKWVNQGNKFSCGTLHEFFKISEPYSHKHLSVACT